jgi:hypothetical protein
MGKDLPKSGKRIHRKEMPNVSQNAPPGRWPYRPEAKVNTVHLMITKHHLKLIGAEGLE